VREVLSPVQRQKLDASDDREFYSQPRLVHHLDANFRAQLTQLYRERIPLEGAAVLDLCSSWVSHLPPEGRYSRVVGHGMNAAELARNPQLSEFVVRNLNREPGGWAFADASFDAVVCCASVQYLAAPEAVFAEIRRVVKLGGTVVVSFSNRMFYQKASHAACCVGSQGWWWTCPC
jgi:SAM-dependent methyltransferase